MDSIQKLEKDSNWSDLLELEQYSKLSDVSNWKQTTIDESLFNLSNIQTYHAFSIENIQQLIGHTYVYHVKWVTVEMNETDQICPKWTSQTIQAYCIFQTDVQTH